jgi:accessory gene regulator B
LIEKAAKSMARFYARKNLIEEDMRASFAYGVELLLSTAVNILLVFAISAALHVTPGAPLFLGGFISLRCAAGGYHADTHWLCIAIFAASYAALALMVSVIPAISLYILLCAIVTALTVYRASPVEAPNKPLAENEKDRLRKISMAIACANMLSALMVCCAPALQTRTAAFWFTGMLSASASMLAALIRKKTGVDTRDENRVDT